MRLYAFKLGDPTAAGPVLSRLDAYHGPILDAPTNVRRKREPIAELESAAHAQSGKAALRKRTLSSVRVLSAFQPP